MSCSKKLNLTPDMKRKLVLIKYNWKTTIRGLDLAVPQRRTLLRQVKIKKNRKNHEIDNNGLSVFWKNYRWERNFSKRLFNI